MKWIQIALCIVFLPIGAPILLWKYTRLNPGIKGIMIAAWAIFVLRTIAMCPPNVPQPAPTLQPPAIRPAVLPAAIPPAPAPAPRRSPVRPAIAAHQGPDRAERDEIVAYVAAAQHLIDETSAAAQESRKCLDELANDPSLLNDDDWKIRMATQLTIFESLDEQLSRIGPIPRSARKANRQLRLAFQGAGRFASLYARGIDRCDTQLLNDGDAEAYASAAHLTKATAELKSLMLKVLVSASAAQAAE